MTAFLKMHGLGNDFVVFDARDGALSLSRDQVRAIADRRRGVGCDTVVVIRPGGAFLTYQFCKAARNLCARYFDRVDDGFEPLNILPCVLAWAWKDAD